MDFAPDLICGSIFHCKNIDQVLLCHPKFLEQGANQVGGKNNYVSASESNRLRQILLCLNQILKNYAEDTLIRVHIALTICGKNETQNIQRKKLNMVGYMGHNCSVF